VAWANSPPMHKSRRYSERPSIAWIYNPWLDLIVGCGAWSAPLLLVSYWSIASSARAWAVAFYALALFFNYPHYMATIYRAYHHAEDFRKYRIFTVHTTALILLTLFLSLGAWRLSRAQLLTRRIPAVEALEPPPCCASTRPARSRSTR